MPSRFVKSGGFFLLLVVLTLLAIGGTILLVGLGSGLSNADRSLAVRASADDTLVRAKLALLGYVVRETNGGTGYRLGSFPTPDSLSDGQYGGNSDSKCLSNSATGFPPITGNSPNNRCLGKFPWKELSLDLGTVDANDPLGRVPWLAISANLSFWDSCIEVLNSDILNSVYSSYACPPTAGALSYPWLKVRSETGAILSDRVAAILILPGAPITTETRTQSRGTLNPTQISDGQASDYLDSIRLPLGCSATCTATYDNASLNNEFIAIPLGTRYPATSEDATKRNQSIAFNDVVIYITIDELVPILERRVLAEMASALRDVSGTVAPKKNIGYPWAATFVSPVSYANFNSQPLSLVGLFPFFVKNETPTPPLGFPTYQTDLDWTVAGLSNPAKTCVQVQTGPNQFIDTRQQITSVVAAAGSLPLASTSCTWKGAAALSCNGTSVASLTSSYTQFSTAARCNTGSPTSGTANYTRQRTISFTADATCSVPGATYAFANGTQPQRWTWSCPSALNTFTVDVSDVFTSTPLAATGSASFNAAGRLVTATTRYQPVMPYWFYQNEWYKTAFYALSPSKAPVLGTTCGTAASSTLIVGGTTVSTAVAVLAGSRLPILPAVPTQTRPTGIVTNYLEGLNATAMTNCVFAGAGAQVSSSYNDQLIVFEP